MAVLRAIHPSPRVDSGKLGKIEIHCGLVRDLDRRLKQWIDLSQGTRPTKGMGSFSEWTTMTVRRSRLVATHEPEECNELTELNRKSQVCELRT